MKIELKYLVFVVGLLFSISLFSQKTVNVNDFTYSSTTDTSNDFIGNNKGIFTISATSTNVTCYGLCDGSITISIAGAPTYPVEIRLRYPADLGGTIVFYSGLIASDFQYTITGLCGSSLPYQIRVRDADNVPAEYQYANAWVLAPGEMIIDDYTIINETCSGACDGSVQINFVQNATYPVTYLWTDGETTSNIINKCAGTYNVTVTDANSCSKVFSYNITAPPTIIVDSLVYNPVFCFGGSGSVTVYASGGSGALQYNIGSGYQASNTFSGLLAGTYTVTVTDGICIGVSNPFTFTENSNITLSAITDSVSCFGLSDGSINLSVAGGTAPYTYIWSNGATTQDIAGLPAGNYCVTVTDNYGCTSTACYDVYEPAVITITETHTNPCFGASDGSINITVSGGSCSNYSYSWSNGAITQDISGLPQGSYTVTVTDCNGCTNTLTVALVQNPQINIAETHVNYDCFGSACMGSINITASGGTPGYTYSWSGPSGYTSTLEDISSLCFGNYTVTVTDAVGCTRTMTITITRPTQITINLVSQTNVTCFGLCNGAININPTGGTPGYTYLWTNGLTTQDISGLCAGSYTVTVTDSKGCTRTRTFTITQPTDISITLVTATNVLCNGTCTGLIDLTVSGGTPAYTYLWSGPNSYSSTNLDISNLCAGVYNLTITDSKPCTKTYSVTITEPNAINLTETQTEVTCNGSCDGAINITVSGGTGAYSYNWTGPGGPYFTDNLSNLCAGTYNLTVTDANLCTFDTSFTLSSPSVITISETHVDLLCNAVCNGSINITPSGGNPCPLYTYSWTGPGGPYLTEDLSNLCAGNYNVTVTDCNGCTATSSINITEPTALTATITSQINVACFGDCSGTATVTAGGGTPGYTYLWCNGNTNPMATNICAGTCDVTVTDSNLCTAVTTVTITPATALTADITAQTNVTCNGLCNGTATVQGNGGTAGYTYQWCNGQITPTATNLCAGVCSVTVTDANGCTATNSVTITEPAVLSVSLVSQTNVSCNGACDGSAQVSVFGGTPGYTYLWCNGSTINPINGLCAGNCTVTVTDTNGCTATYTVTITQPTALTSNITAQINISCGGNCNGSATVSASGGTPTYSYLWCDGQTTSTATNLCAGVCGVTITDSNGCNTTSSVTITAPPSLSATISDSTMSCGSFPTVVAGTTFLPDGTGLSYTTTITQTDFPSGATINSTSDISSICLNMEHSWLGDLNIDLTCPNGQSINLKDAFGGGGTYLGEPVSVGYPDQNSSDITPGTGYDYCFVPSGATYGTMSATASTYVYSYIDNAGNSHVNRYYLPAGTYTPFQSFNNLLGCPINGNWTISVFDNMGLDNGYIFSWLINFDPSTYPYQYCNGSAIVTTAGGQAPYTYFWSNGATTDTINNLCSGTYCVTVNDANGCSSTDCVDIVDVNLNITNFTKTDASCNGVCNGSATVNTSGGYAPITYIWSNGQVTQTINNLCAGQYIVTVTEVNGCSTSDTVIISNSYAVNISTNVINNETCNGACDGSGTVNVISGGVPPYSYVWCNTQTTQNVTNLCAGACSVTVTDNNGCVSTSSLNITSPIVVTASITSQTNVSCNGLCDGSATVTANGGTLPYNYTWSCGGQITSTASNLCAGNCSVTVSDANGCTAIASVTITEPPVLTSSITSQTNVSCNGLCDGSATVTANGGTMPYNYLWCNSQSTSNVNGLCAGVCTVTITDFNGCTVTSNVTITEPNAITTSLVTQTNVNCNGLCNGSATVSTNGGSIPYSYLWCNSQTNSTVNGLCAGNCTVTVTDANSCTSTFTVTITEPSLLTSSFTSFTQVNCGGTCTGSLTISGSGGSLPYTYTWSPNVGNTATINSLCAGIYNVTITDSLNCTTTNWFEITDTSNLQLNLITSTNPTCFGLCNGSGTVAANGGYPAYTYTWPTVPVQTGPIAINLCNGVYTVTVQDTALCSRQINVTITEPAVLSFTTTSTSPVCSSDCNGTATANVSGGTLPYSYLWCNSQITQTTTGLCAGNCGITVSDANNCPVAPQSVTITSPPVLTATLDITQNITCNSSCDGVLTANPSGGVASYSYSWSPNITENQQIADSLCAATYNVTVTDFNGCTIAISQTLNSPLPIVITITDTIRTGCLGACNGSATVAGSGGTPPYSYLWDANAHNDTTAMSDSLCGGFYSVTITDLNGCTASTLVNIVDTSNLSLTLVSAINPTCFGQCNGAITVNATGGFPHPTWRYYQYNWDDLQIDSSAVNLCAGNHFVTVTDDSLCSVSMMIPLINPPQFLDSIISVPASCNGSCDGMGIVAIVDGLGMVINDSTSTYLWDDPLSQTNDTASGLCQGIYYVTITNTSGCSIIDSVIITSPPSLTLGLSQTASISCYNTCNGSVAANISGGTLPYSLIWSNALTTDTISGLCAGTYILTVTDANLCQIIDSITITQPDSLQLSFINVTQIACGGGNCTGQATAQVTGGTPNYTYLWSLNANTGDTATADSLCGNIYNLTVTDFNGCTVSGNVTIIDTSNLSLTIIDTNMVTCSGLCNGSATAQASGGYPPYSFTWSTVPVQTTATAVNLCQGTYYVTVVDTALCSRIVMIDITDAAAVQATDSVIPISCSGLCDASIMLNTIGGIPPYSFNWSNSSTNDTLTNLCAGTYYYTITDASSCTFTDSITISDPGTMLANLSIINPVLCHGVCLGSVTTNPLGSLGPYTIIWSNGDTTQTISNLCGGMYYVTVTGIGGCSVSDSINLPEPDTLSITFTNILQVNCGGDCSGSVTAVASGGTPNYNYQWDSNAGNATTQMIDSLCANIYFITITDNNACQFVSNFEVTDTSNMSVIVLDSAMISCYGKCDGWATVLASGGTLPYSYLWNNTPIADTIDTADSLCVGMYRVTVSDINLCSRVKLVNITQPDSMYALITDSIPINCFGNCNGELTVSVFGGTPNYNLIWNSGLTDTTIQNLCIGNYSLTVTDSHLCTDSIKYSLISPPQLVSTLTANGALCNNGTSDGSIITTVIGGVSPYTFLWSNDSTTQNLNNLISGNYYLTITDSLGCVKIDSTNISASITVNATAKFDTTICYNDTVQIFGFGGTSFTWTPSLGLSDTTIFNPVAFPTQTTTYYFTAWDSICFDIDSVTIQVYPQIGVNAGSDQTILADHSATISATSIDLTATFLWSPTTWLSDSTNSTTVATPPTTTPYIVIATNANGCTETDTVLITVIPKIIIPTGITPNNDGANDVWMIDFISYYPNCEVEIYNRWGEKLFYSKGYPDNERWDGNYKGKPLPTGTYYYIINLHDEVDTKPITGPITIMR